VVRVGGPSQLLTAGTAEKRPTVRIAQWQAR
jgi:hypothetical protein